MKLSLLFTTILGIAGTISAVELDITNTSSIHAAQALVAQGMMDYYNGKLYK
jgi:hypothetical protein